MRPAGECGTYVEGSGKLADDGRWPVVPTAYAAAAAPCLRSDLCLSGRARGVAPWLVTELLSSACHGGGCDLSGSLRIH